MLDVGVEWVLTQNVVPVQEPENSDSSLRPPMERDDNVSPVWL